jgi:predicted ATPase
MEDRFAFSVTCPVLIGREEDLAALHRLAGEATHGHGQVAFVSGEAGVGKSRLLAETASFARHQGFFHLQGQCFQTDSALPYAPFLDLLHSSVHTGLLESIYTLTDGNPFFIEEVLKSLIASGEIAAKNGVGADTPAGHPSAAPAHPLQRSGCRPSAR